MYLKDQVQAHAKGGVYEHISLVRTIRLTSFKYLETQFLRPLRQNRGPLGVGWYPPELVEISGSQKQNSGNEVGLGLRRRKVTQGFKVTQGSPRGVGGSPPELVEIF